MGTSRTVFRYWFEDGLEELLLGVVFVTVAVLSWWASLPTMWLAILSLVGLVAAWYAAKMLKQEWTYPRGGYVEHRSDKWPYVFGIVSGIVVVFLYYLVPVGDKIEVFTTGGLAFGLLGAAVHSGLLRLGLVGLATLALAVSAVLAPELLTFGDTMGIEGVLLLASGTVGFLRYRAETEDATEERAARPAGEPHGG